jgi:hypothetical protein
VSNFQLTNAPTLQPAVDYLTRSSVGPFIDTGRDAPMASGRGKDRIYVSVDTVRHMADLAGILDKPSNTALDEAYRRGVVDGIRAELGVDLARVVDVLDRWLPLIRDVDVPEGEHAAV